MKKIIFVFAAITTLAVVSCNSNSSSKRDNGKAQHDSIPMQDNSIIDKDVKMVAVTFTSVDPAVSTYMKSIVTNYLAIKNALTNGNGTEAASASAKMEKAIKGFDKSLLSAEQKKVYDEIEEDLKEHAEHIGENGSDVKHQRSHFSMMSGDVYDLVKAFGGGMVLYHDHCPMYNDGQGAIWLSESKEIRNPYFGDKMMTCGIVEEMFK